MQGFGNHVSRKVRTFPKKTAGTSKDSKKSRQGASWKNTPKFSESRINDFQNYEYVEKKVGRRQELFVEDDSEEDEEVDQDGLENQGEQEEQDRLEDQDEQEDQDGLEDQDEIVSAQFREDVANMPLSKVKELKNRLGIKLFNKAFFGVEEKMKAEVKEDQKVPKTTQFKRANSKRPREISSKKPVSKFRNIYANEKKNERISIDPRFDSRYGELNQAHFEQNYTHIHELQLSEMTDLKNELKEAKNDGDEARVREIKNTLKRMQDRERTKKDRDLKRQTIVELRQENMKRMKEGIAPVFKTRADVRRLHDERKRGVLQKEGNLDKYLERKEKKQKQKENRLKRKLTSEDHGLR